MREKIALTIHFGGLPRVTTDFIIGKGDRGDALKVWGSIADEILRLIREEVEKMDTADLNAQVRLGFMDCRDTTLALLNRGIV